VRPPTWLCVLACVLNTACPSRSPRPTPRHAGPSFRKAIEPILTEHCAAADGCHGERPSPSVSLDLRRGHAYAALVSRAAETRARALRVVPGEPEKSFLIDKLRGTLAFGEGKPMPVDPETGAPLDATSLPAGFVESTLSEWILAGAHDE